MHNFSLFSTEFLVDYSVTVMRLANCSTEQLDSGVLHSGILFNFSLDVRKDMKSKYAELPKLNLSNIDWKIIISVKSIEQNDKKEEVIGIYLKCCFETGQKWSCEAKAAFKLNTAGEKDSLLQELPTQNFNNDCSTYGVESFIEWNDFVRNYVKKDKAHFEIELLSNPLMLGGPIDIEKVGRVFNYMIKNVSKLGEHASDEVIVRNIKWKVVAKKTNDSLEAYLVIPNENELDVNWSWEAKAKFTLLSFNRKIKPLHWKFSEVFRWGANSWGIHLMKWADFVDPQKYYVARDSAILVTDLTVEPAEPIWKH